MTRQDHDALRTQGRVRQTPVRPVRENLLCDCGLEMTCSPVVLAMDPPIYQYACTCGKWAWSKHHYPRIVHS